MTMILDELNKVFCEVFKTKDLVITLDSNASTLEGWDSLTHVALVSETEKHFKITFSFNEMMQLRNVGDLVKAIEKHLQH